MESQKKKNRRKRKIFIVLLMFLFTLSLFATSTYAWFTANKTVTIEQLDVNVGAESGLQLSVDGINWKPLITNADINGAKTTYGAAVNHIPTESIHPVSTGAVIDPATGYMNMYKGLVETNGDHYVLSSTKSTESAATAGSFIVFDLFVRMTDAAGSDIYLTNASKVISDNSKGLENAARVAFVHQGEGTTADSAAALQALKAGADSPVYIWEPNANAHTAAALKHGTDTYGINADGLDKVAYNGVIAEFGKTADVRLNDTAAERFKPMENIVTTPTGEIPYTKYFRLNNGVTKFRVYVWVEGQDIDCENDASGSKVSYNIQLSMNAAA